MKTKRVISILLSITVIMACEKTNPDDLNGSGYTNGIIITNEGGFGNSNGSVSFLDRDSIVMQNNLFFHVNGRPLGDVVQSLTVHQNKAFIVVNNSQKVEVVDLEDFTSVGYIQGLSYPRYFLGIDDNKGYLSNGAMDGLVYVIDLQNLTIKDSIQVGFGPEQMILKDGIVYVANSGGWLNDNTITLIDSENDEVLETIEVGDNPAAFCEDKNGDIWILCKGKVVWAADYSIEEETNSELIKFSTATNQIITRMETGLKGDYFWPTRIAVNPAKDNILFIESDGIYQVDLGSVMQPGSPFVTGSFYGFGVDPQNGDIYGLSAGDFSSAGWLYRYKDDGLPIDTLQVGIAPNTVIFN